MDRYPWTLEGVIKKNMENKESRYTKEHLSFVGWAFRAILNSVNQLHQLGYVHRDLKLDNFMVDASCIFWLI